MKIFTKNSLKNLLLGLSVVGLLGTADTSSAQTHIGRTYADKEAYKNTIGLGTASVTNASNVIGKTDTNLSDSSTLSVTGLLLSPSTTQYLEFTTDGTTPRVLPAGTKVFIKFAAPNGLLGLNVGGLLGNLEFGSFTNLGGTATNASATKTAITNNDGGSLISLLTGAGTNEISITTTKSSNGIYVSLTGLIAAGATANLFHAYVYDNLTGDGECPKAIDWVSGTTADGGLANAASATGSVINPSAAIDGNPNTAATISTGAVALSVPYYTTILNTPAKAGDSIRVVINNPNGGLLNLSLLGTDFSIQAYNGNTAVGSAYTSGSSLLKLQLLPGSTSKNIITVPVTAGDFDRFTISVGGGVANVSSLLGNGNVDVYEAGIEVPAPTVDAATQLNQYVYAGNSTTLNASMNGNSDPIVWFTDSTGSTVVPQPVVTTTAEAGTVVTYYAASQRNGCTDASARTKVSLHIIAASLNNATNGTVGTPYSFLFVVPATTPAPINTPAYVYTLASGTLPPDLTLNSDGTLTGTPTTAGGPYTFTIHVVDTNNKDASGNPLVVGDFPQSVTIDAALAVSLTSFNATLNTNKTVSLKWVTASEQDNKTFNVQRSSDGVSFNTIGSVAGSGTTSNANTYEYTDNKPTAVAYYRLEMVKIDGTLSWSGIKSINGGGSLQVSISPNPVNNMLNITNATNIKSASIYDATGRKVLTSGSQTQINVNGLGSGVYYIQINLADGTTSSLKFIKL